MSEKSFLDKMFDAADQALTPLEKALSDAPAPQKQDIIDVDDVDDRHGDWEKTFNTTHWAVVENLGGSWHALRGETMVTVCGKTAKLTQNRQVLEHDKVIPACTSCIIGVSK